MLRVESNESRTLLTFTFSRHVTEEELKAELPNVRDLIENMEPGFVFLTDLTNVESMEQSCSAEIGEIMTLANAKEVSEVRRVIPDPQKDIGFTVMSRFHYDHAVKMTTFESLDDALQSLSP